MTEFEEEIKKVLEPTKPKDCFECAFFGDKPKNLNILFEFLCRKGLFWFLCGGKQGIKKKYLDGDEKKK